MPTPVWDPKVPMGIGGGKRETAVGDEKFDPGWAKKLQWVANASATRMWEGSRPPMTEREAARHGLAKRPEKKTSK